ncbi:hypothetical protein ACFL2Q_00925 [Thermodesulfobacteriota bacterium]
MEHIPSDENENSVGLRLRIDDHEKVKKSIQRIPQTVAEASRRFYDILEKNLGPLLDAGKKILTGKEKHQALERTIKRLAKEGARFLVPPVIQGYELPEGVREHLVAKVRDWLEGELRSYEPKQWPTLLTRLAWEGVTEGKRVLDLPYDPDSFQGAPEDAEEMTRRRDLLRRKLEVIDSETRAKPLLPKPEGDKWEPSYVQDIPKVSFYLPLWPRFKAEIRLNTEVYFYELPKEVLRKVKWLYDFMSDRSEKRLRKR